MALFGPGVPWGSCPEARAGVRVRELLAGASTGSGLEWPYLPGEDRGGAKEREERRDNLCFLTNVFLSFEKSPCLN